MLRRLRIHGFYGHPWLPIWGLYGLEKANQAVLSAALNELRPDVVHVWNMGGISKSLLHTLEQSSTPLVYDVSDHWIARSLQADVWLNWWNEPGSTARQTTRVLAKATGLRKLITRQVPTAPARDLRFPNIYFCSRFMRDLTARQGYPVEHADIVYCGVEAEHFQRKTAYHPPQKFLWVGRLAEDKDPLTAIEGFCLAREVALHPLELDVYGHGSLDYTRKLENAIKKAGAEACIQLKSATHEAMRALYAQYDAYIFSSNWGEPFALTPLEAMASGVPVLMCPDGGDAELVDDGVNALEFTPGSPDSLAAAIARLLRLPDHGESLCRKALARVEEEFTVDVMTRRIEAILEASIKRQRG